MVSSRLLKLILSSVALIPASVSLGFLHWLEKGMGSQKHLLVDSY